MQARKTEETHHGCARFLPSLRFALSGIEGTIGGGATATGGELRKPVAEMRNTMTPQKGLHTLGERIDLAGDSLCVG